jgi:pimeloyl-ACP methyl ester carboxylesterase
MRTVVSLLVIAAVVYLGLGAWVVATQRSQIYFPVPETHRPDAQVLWIESQGERLKVWTVVRPGSRALLYFGGNAEDVAGNLEAFSAAFPDRSLFLVNYRGYGGSSGRPSEAALFADALAVFDHVRREQTEIAVMGRSLGSGVAAWVASERPVEQLVLVTAFDSLVNVAKEYFRWLPVGWLMRDRYDSASRAAAVKAPVLVVIAGEDEIIPRLRSEALVKAFPASQVGVEVVPGVGHNTLDESSGYLESVARFLQRAGEVREPAT